MPATAARISSSAVERATGKTWDDWHALLDAAGANSMTHQEIVRLVRKHGVGPWWEQMVTVGYEYARAKRTVGKTATVGFEVGVQKTLAVTPRRAWSLLMTPPGRDLWLGKLARFRLAKGAAYETAEGNKGQVRSLTAGKHLRMTWSAAGGTRGKAPSTLQIHFVPSGDGTSIRFHQEKLASASERERMRQRWRRVLEQLEALAEA